MKQPRHTDPLPLGGDGIPYSKGLMARALIATGMRPVPAYELARRIDGDIQDRNSDSVELERIHELAVGLLGEAEADDAFRRLRRFEELHNSREFMPTIHYSSFEAGGMVSGVATDQAIAGFLEQTRNVLVGVGAAMDRALEEGWSMVLEGVHLVPGMLPSAVEDALFVQCVLAVEDEDKHRGRFYVRDVGSEGKRAQDRYLESFEEIRAIQEFIVQRAREHEVAVVENSDPERSIVEVMELVFSSVGEVEGVRSG